MKTSTSPSIHSSSCPFLHNTQNKTVSSISPTSSSVKSSLPDCPFLQHVHQNGTDTKTADCPVLAQLREKGVSSDKCSFLQKLQQSESNVDFECPHVDTSKGCPFLHHSQVSKCPIIHHLQQNDSSLDNDNVNSCPYLRNSQKTSDNDSDSDCKKQKLVDQHAILFSMDDLLRPDQIKNILPPLFKYDVSL